MGWFEWINWQLMVFLSFAGVKEDFICQVLSTWWYVILVLHFIVSFDKMNDVEIRLKWVREQKDEASYAPNAFIWAAQCSFSQCQNRKCFDIISLSCMRSFYDVCLTFYNLQWEPIDTHNFTANYTWVCELCENIGLCVYEC